MSLMAGLRQDNLHPNYTQKDVVSSYSINIWGCFCDNYRNMAKMPLRQSSPSEPKCYWLRFFFFF